MPTEFCSCLLHRGMSLTPTDLNVEPYNQLCDWLCFIYAPLVSYKVQRLAEPLQE